MDDLQAAITPQTAMVYTTWADDERLERILKITKPAGVPVLLDDRGRHSSLFEFHALRKDSASIFIVSAAEKVCAARNVPECC